MRDAGCDEIYCAVMDGAVTEEFGVGEDLVKAVVDGSDLPVSVHLLVGDPDRKLGSVSGLQCKTLYAPLEASVHLHRMVQSMRDTGMEAGLSLNPGTPLTKLEYVLPHLDRVLLLGSESISSNEAVRNSLYERVHILKENISYEKYRAKVYAAGNVTPADAARLLQQGADGVVLTGRREGAVPAGTWFRAFKREAEAVRPVV